MAQIHLSGSYATSKFHFSNLGGNVEITHPAVPGGGTVQIGSANPALLADYMATSFVSGSTGYGTVLTDENHTSEAPMLTHPHT